MMGMLEKISENLDSSEANRVILRRAMCTLMVDWREFEKHTDSTQKCFQECLSELESKEKKLDSFEESVRRSSEELELLRKSFEKRVREVESKEKELEAWKEKGMMELGLKEKEWELSREKVVEEFRDRERKLNEKEALINGFFEKLETDKNELGLKEREWDLGREKMLEEFKEKERKLNEKEVLINGFIEKLEADKNELAGLEKLVEERLREVGLKEERIEEKRKEIEMIQDGVRKREIELDDRERKVRESGKMVGFKGLDLLRVDQERQIKMEEEEVNIMREDLEIKEKEVDILISVNEKRVKELGVREKQMEAKEKQLEIAQAFMKEVNLQMKQCKEDKKKLERGNKELEVKRRGLEDELGVIGKQLKAKRKELEVTQKGVKEFQLKKRQPHSEKEWLDGKLKESAEVREEELEDRMKGLQEVEAEEKQLEATRKELEVAEESLRECQSEKELLECQIMELEVKKKEAEGWIKGVKELQAREKKLEAKRKELELEEERLEECHLRKKQRQTETELLEKGNIELEMNMKKFEELVKAFELREKELQVKEKKLNDVVVCESLDTSSSSPHFRFSVELDGQDVHMTLNDRKIDLSSKDEVFKALQLSGDPVYMVLVAMETLYPPYLRKVDMEFEGSLAQSCILLLEQLIRISPKVRSSVRDEAIKLAREWKATMNRGNSLEVLGFLYLLASFDLAFAFDSKELVKFLETVAEHQQTPKLCPLLGLTDKIPGVIQDLLKSDHYLQAVGIICAFELFGDFPLVPILKSYLKYVKKIAKAMSKKRSNKEAQNEAIDQRVAALGAVIKIIVDHKLESQFSPKILEASIKQLLMHKELGICSGSIVHQKAQEQKEVEHMEISSTSGSDLNRQPQDQKEVEDIDIPSTTSGSFLKGCNIAPEFLNTEIDPLLAMALILSNMSGKSLLSFLDAHLVEHRFLQNAVFTALQISDDAAKLVLDAVEVFYRSDPQVPGSRSCIFLLKQFQKIPLPPSIVVDVHEIAKQIAFDWKSKMVAEIESPVVILVFLLFINAFRLAPAFYAVELLQLYNIVLKHKSVSGLCEDLGIFELVSESNHVRVEDLQLEIKSASCTKVLTNDAKCLSIKLEMESEKHVLCCSGIPKFIQNSPDPALLVLDALDFSYFSNYQKNTISPLVCESFFYLLKQLINVFAEIKPSVKGRASKLALNWKSTLTGSNSWEVLAFLQFLVVYGLSSSFSAEYLLGLLEVPCQLKEASNLIRNLGLEDKVPGFILDLVKKKQRLLAFEYVYEFNLVDKIPPVALLKKHVSHSKLAAMEMCVDGQATLEAQGRACDYEISALKSVIKCILDRGLQSTYPPDELKERAAQLESRRENLKASMPTQAFESWQKLDKSEQDTSKRPACDNAIKKAFRSRPPKRSRRLAATPADAAPNHDLSSGQSSHRVKPSSSSYPSGRWHAKRVVSHVQRGNNCLGGFDPTEQQAGRRLDADVGHGNMVYSGFPFYQVGWVADRFPPYRLAEEQFLP